MKIPVVLVTTRSFAYRIVLVAPGRIYSVHPCVLSLALSQSNRVTHLAKGELAQLYVKLCFERSGRESVLYYIIY